MQQVQERVLSHAQAGHSMAGSCFWCLAAPSYPDFDGFRVLLQHYDQHQQQQQGIAQPKLEQPPGKRLKAPPPARATEASRLDASNGTDAAQQSSGVGTHSQSVAREDSAAEASQIEEQGGDAKVHNQAASKQHFRDRSGGDDVRSSQQLRQPRVSEATQENCEAAALMFETGTVRVLEAAKQLDEDTARLIWQHAGLMRRLNVHQGGKICQLM